MSDMEGARSWAWRPMVEPRVLELWYDDDVYRWKANVLHVCGHESSDLVLGEWDGEQGALKAAIIHANGSCGDCEKRCDARCAGPSVATADTSNGVRRFCRVHALMAAVDVPRIDVSDRNAYPPPRDWSEAQQITALRSALRELLAEMDVELGPADPQRQGALGQLRLTTAALLVSLPNEYSNQGR